MKLSNPRSSLENNRNQMELKYLKKKRKCLVAVLFSSTVNAACLDTLNSDLQSHSFLVPIPIGYCVKLLQSLAWLTHKKFLPSFKGLEEDAKTLKGTFFLIMLGSIHNSEQNVVFRLSFLVAGTKSLVTVISFLNKCICVQLLLTSGKSLVGPFGWQSRMRGR